MALYASCGREPEKRTVPEQVRNQEPGITQVLEEKMRALSKELADETDHQKQQEILKSINALMETLAKAKEMGT